MRMHIKDVVSHFTKPSMILENRLKLRFAFMLFYILTPYLF